MNDLLVQLTTLAEQAGRSLNDSSGGRSVCRLHKTGQVTNRLKFCEGSEYVARRALRAAQSDRGSDGVLQVLDELERKNRAIRDSPVLTSPDWQSYAQGALEMVGEIRDLLATSARANGDAQN